VKAKKNILKCFVVVIVTENLKQKKELIITKNFIVEKDNLYNIIILLWVHGEFHV